LVAWLATLATARRAVSALDAAMALACGLPVGVVAFAWAAFREEAGLVAVMASLAPLAGALAYLRLRDLARRDAALAYWEAHRAAGGSLADRVLRYGIAGAWRAPLLALLGFLLRVAVAVEAALSYLGFGVVEPQASFGNILAAHFELYLRGEWRVLAVVAAALALAAAFPSALLEVGAALARSRVVAWAAAPWLKPALPRDATPPPGGQAGVSPPA
jgi:ABC-type dipeptide/oligopeptide/nickel transport system permease subunit